jgi:hypothetical protein
VAGKDCKGTGLTQECLSPLAKEKLGLDLSRRDGQEEEPMINPREGNHGGKESIYQGI